MKRRREAEEKDTADSHQVRRKRKIMEPDFWTLTLRTQFLEEIVAARERRGLYNFETSWSTKCWNLVVRKLKVRNILFQNVTVQDLKNEIGRIKTGSGVHFNSQEPPLGEWDRLVYEAFKIGPLATPPDNESSVRRNRSQSHSTSLVNMTSNRTTTNTTNVNAGSCSGGSHTVEDEELVDLLLPYQDDITPKEFAYLTRRGQYRIFSRLSNVLSRAEFVVAYLKNYINS